MVAVERKLDALTSALTSRQRAILVLSAWLRGETADERLYRFCPPADLAEFEAMRRAVNRGNELLRQTGAYLLEWIAQIEMQIHWLRTLEMYQRREKAIASPVRKTLPPLLSVWETSRQTARAFGRHVSDEEPEPRTWEEFSARLARTLLNAIQQRWQDYLQGKAALEEASEALGIDATHRVVRELFERLEDDILRLARMMGEAGHAVKLPELDRDAESYAATAFKLEVLREFPREKHERESLHAQARAELEAWEKEQAESFDE